MTKRKKGAVSRGLDMILHHIQSAGNGPLFAFGHSRSVVVKLILNIFKYFNNLLIIF